MSTVAVGCSGIRCRVHEAGIILCLLLSTGVSEAPVVGVTSQPLRITAQVLLGGQVNPELPNSDSDLRCIVNLNEHARSYPLNQWAIVPLVTDFSVFLESGPNADLVYQEVQELLKRHNPKAPVGTYISGGRVEPVIKQYPPEAIREDGIPENWRRPSTDRVDLANPEAADRFAQLIIDACQGRKGQIVFLDNVVHPSELPGWFPWNATCRFLRLVQRGVHGADKLLIANIAGKPWGMSDEDARLLGDAVDGMSFEMPFHQYARGNRERTEGEIRALRTWLSQGKVVVLIPVVGSTATEEEGDREARLIAAFAMLIRNRGDRLFVAWPFWKPVADWADWPKRLGEPAGEWEFEADGVLSRRFQGGTLRVDVLKREVHLTAPR